MLNTRCNHRCNWSPQRLQRVAIATCTMCIHRLRAVYNSYRLQWPKVWKVSVKLSSSSSFSCLL